ncbi:MAG: hypothetical protein LBS05_04445 [Tannerellaceae bacterium]|jgi:cytochrome c biogenesis protein CcdA|nr:hypothetical protein [Tannerellaceae bacterium]
MNRKKILSGSFLLVMAIHLVVFTAIGLFTTKGWRLLIIFIAGFLLIFIGGRLLRLYSKRHPEKKRLARWISFFQKQ